MKIVHLICSAMLFSQTVCAHANTANNENWVATWSAAPDQAGPVLGSMTVRQIVRTSAGGSKIRIRLSNIYGNGAVTIAAAHLAVHTTGSAIKPGTDHALTFNGAGQLKMAKGESVLSDPVNMDVTALQELAISLYLPAQSGVSTIHGVALENAYLKRGMDASAALSLPSAKTGTSRYFLTDIEVSGNGEAGTIVALGDSITDGVGSTENTNRRWTDILATRLQSVPTPLALVNSGIAGNRILKGADDPFRGDSALSRFDRDALEKPGVRWVILDMGNNDIAAASVLGTPRARATSEQVIEGIKTLIAHAHVKGIYVLGTTRMPFAGADFGSAKHPYYSPAVETKRQALNDWIRNSHAFDEVIDFDQILRDPAHPEHLLPAYDSGDHLHPNDTGHRVMAEAFDLRKFSSAIPK